MILDLDKALNMHLILRQGDNYDRVFFVKSNGADYDWANVEDLILQIKTTKKAETATIELKKSTNDIEIATGQMTWHLPPSKTDVTPADYKSLELLLLFPNSKPKLWIDGTSKVLERGIKLG
jgi:hypothetical protein